MERADERGLVGEPPRLNRGSTHDNRRAGERPAAAVAGDVAGRTQALIGRGPGAGAHAPTRSSCGWRPRPSILPISGCCSPAQTWPRRSSTGTPERPVVTAPLPERRAAAARCPGRTSPCRSATRARAPWWPRGPPRRRRRCSARPCRWPGVPCTRSTGRSMRRQCLVLPDGTPARDGASAFVNPLTALGMVETMRREGHTGLVHTAAASNLGQMLVGCASRTAVPLVNIVRKPEQEELLRSLGATYVPTRRRRRSWTTSSRRSRPRRPRWRSTPRAAASWPVRS